MGLQKDLKSTMTGKQFNQIIEYFLRGITGKDLQTLGGKGDIHDAIISILESINCPYTIKKSMLKAPNALHTFDQMIILLLWLSDFQDETFDDDSQMNFIFLKDEELPNQEFTEIFSKSMMKGFQLWNSESAEFAELNDQLVDKFVCTSLKDNVKSCEELFQKIEQLKKDSKELKKLPTVIPNQELVERIESKFLAYESQEQSLCDELKEKQNRLDGINILWNEKMKKYQSKEESVLALKDVIKKQTVSVAEYKSMALEITKLKSYLNSVEIDLNNIRSNKSSNLVNRARVLKQISTAIPELNERISRIVTIVTKCQLNINTNALNSLICTPESVNLKHLHLVDATILKVEMKFKENITKNISDSEHLTNELLKLKAEAEMLIKDHENMQKKHKKCTSDEQILDGTVKMHEKKHENFENKIKQEMNASKMEYNKLEGEIVASKEKIKQLEQEIENMMIESEKQARGVIERKYEMAEEIDEQEKLLDDLIASSDILEGFAE